MNKKDKYKLRFDLIDPYFEQELAKVMTFGAIKYQPDAWKKIQDAKQRYIAALKRHLNALERGITHDDESGLRVTAHIAANTMFLDYFIRRRADANSNIQSQNQSAAADEKPWPDDCESGNDNTETGCQSNKGHHIKDRDTSWIPN